MNRTILRLLPLAAILASGAFAGTVELQDWCFYAGTANPPVGDPRFGIDNCNGGSGFATPIDGIRFDVSASPNTLGSVTVHLGSGVYNVLAYYDYNLASSGSISEFATVAGAPGVDDSYQIDDPANSLFSAFASAVLSNTNNVETAGGLPNPCCDVAVTQGFVNYTVPAGKLAEITFSVSDLVPSSGWYIIQTDSDSGATIYFTQTASLSDVPAVVPEPRAGPLFLGALAGLAGWRRRTAARSALAGTFK